MSACLSLRCRLQRRGLTWWQGRFYIMKACFGVRRRLSQSPSSQVHIDVTALFLSLILWGISHVLIGHSMCVCVCVCNLVRDRTGKDF